MDIIELFRSSGIELTEGQAEKFKSMTEFMLEYNKKVNLTRITEPDEILEKHYLDSILPLTMVDVPRGTSIADVGTGAGFPALPMKIYRDDLDFTLIDSLKKRITYLEALCEKLGITCRIKHIRGEEAGREKDFRGKFDFVTARAVASLNVLCEYCIPLLKKNGYFIALKGEKEETTQAEEAIKTLGAQLTDVKKYILPCGDKRSLIIIKKIKETPPIYPRSSAAIAKRPL